MLLGDSSVGKTCLLVRFKDGAFLGGNFIATVGIDFRVRDAVKQPQSNSSHSCFLWAVMFTVYVCMYVCRAATHQSAVSLRSHAQTLSARLLLS